MRSIDQRRNLLTAALAVLEIGWPDRREPPVVSALRGWLSSWGGLGHIVVGMNAQEYELELQQFPHGWGATFFPAGRIHSIVQGFAWEPTAWAAVQKVALEALCARARQRERTGGSMHLIPASKLTETVPLRSRQAGCVNCASEGPRAGAPRPAAARRGMWPSCCW
jgi:hypothetical protein